MSSSQLMHVHNTYEACQQNFSLFEMAATASSAGKYVGLIELQKRQVLRILMAKCTRCSENYQDMRRREGIPP